jgi:superfamily II DNA or RNA helicase
MKQCKIIVKDEVNVKIEGLELAERKALMKMFEYEVPGARYLPAVRLGRWNGKVSYFSLAGSTYINLLEEILPVLDRAGYDIELDDTRDYTTTFEFAEVSESTFSHKNWPKGHPKEGEPVVLRDYQITIVNNFLKNPQSLQEIATGAGKTLMTAALSYSIEQYGRSIVIVPNKSLVTQTEADYINLGLDVGVYFGDRKEYNKTHTICTWQSLNNMLKKTKAGEADIMDFIEGVVCVMVDEVHMAKADALKTLLTGVFAKVPIRWGLTGTIPKAKFEVQ